MAVYVFISGMSHGFALPEPRSKVLVLHNGAQDFL
jgi:hypothetical protein